MPWVGTICSSVMPAPRRRALAACAAAPPPRHQQKGGSAMALSVVYDLNLSMAGVLDPLASD